MRTPRASTPSVLTHRRIADRFDPPRSGTSRHIPTYAPPSVKSAVSFREASPWCVTEASREREPLAPGNSSPPTYFQPPRSAVVSTRGTTSSPAWTAGIDAGGKTMQASTRAARIGWTMAGLLFGIRRATTARQRRTAAARRARCLRFPGTTTPGACRQDVPQGRIPAAATAHDRCLAVRRCDTPPSQARGVTRCAGVSSAGRARRL